MFKTGTISFFTEVAGGVDGNGDPIAATKSQSAFIECNIDTLSKGYQTLVEGQWLNSAFSMYIMNSNLTGITVHGTTEIQLKDNNGNDLGIFQVQNIEYLNLTQRTKIVV